MKFPPRFAALVVLAAAGPASAAIVYSGVQNILIPTNFDGVYLDIIPATPTTPGAPSGSNDAGSFTISHSEPANWDVNFFFGGLGIAHTDDFNPYREDGAGDDIFSPIHNLGLNTYIDGTATGVSEPLVTPSFGGSGDSSGSASTNHVGTNALQFESGVEGYMAFVLEDGMTTYYGWMRVTLTDDGTPGTIHDWAYDTNPINIGAIPEPGTLALLLAGSLLAFRRRR